MLRRLPAGGAHPGARLIGIERDPGRASAAAGVFRGLPAVPVHTGDWRQLQETPPA
jgi:hypothetical protein